MKEKSVLEMRNIHKSFPGVRALQAVDFNLQEGEIHALMGENGAGKSTLIKVLTGVYEKDEGEIFLKGNDKAVVIKGCTESRNQYCVPGDYTLSKPLCSRKYVHRPYQGRWNELEADERRGRQNLTVT